MRALLDYHHGDLLESLLMLLEDRLKIQCFVPAGRDWWDRGYWAFGKSSWGDDRLARQFLTPDNILRDDSHPKRTHRLIELSAAREFGWDFIVASLPDNYEGYQKLAGETDAKLVIQVGNVNQPAGWQYNPHLILNSSSAEIQGRSIRYHQEFHVDDFAPTPIKNPSRITNLVNCPAQLPCYPTLTEAKTLLPEFEWRIHGIDGDDGNLKPTAAVGAAMQDAGWGWHDKVTGDGFGHVIHGWACVGRPLIGHSEHYAGQMAAPFWEDGVTCVDLDRHPLNEAAAMVRDITADSSRHQAMGEAIRQRFVELVDFDAEAEQIAAALL